MKAILTLLIGITLCYFANAQSQVRTATVSKQLAPGGNWNSVPATGYTTTTFYQLVSNAGDSKGLQISLSPNGNSTTLVFSGFGFAVPAGQRVDSVIVSVLGRASSPTDSIFVTLARVTAAGFDPLSLRGGNVTGFARTNVDTVLRIGENAPLATYWDAALTPAIVNGADFGIAFRVKNFNATLARVTDIDSISVKVAYSNPALPVKFTSFNASKETMGTELIWKVGTEENVKTYEIEKSLNGSPFLKVGTVPAQGLTTYRHIDKEQNLGTALYRIKNVDLDGNYFYSSTIKLDNGKALIVLKAFPLPARNNLTIQHNKAIKGAKITISNQEGRIVKTLIAETGAIQTETDLSTVTPGLYVLRIDNGLGNIETLKFIKQ